MTILRIFESGSNDLKDTFTEKCR